MNLHSSRPPLTMWAGLECTLNRVRDRFVDQCALNGHDQRIEADIESFADLGVARVRYPILWEKVAARGLNLCDWSLSDRAMATFQKRGVHPIAGLIHHGSGPSYTSLLDPEFPEKLAAYAAKVAERYPGIDAYTPVNEPLTTARFSCLYGFWYPHATSDTSFIRALYNELKGTVLAMRAIRKINPSAILVQTEDLGLAKGTPPLRYQVDFENMRRWLTYDFLCGVIDERHSMFKYLRERGGLTTKEILWFRTNSFAPDIIGINHYPLSNRFLDHRLELYPAEFHGRNGRDRYADVGAVDTGQVVPPKPVEIIREVWERYRRPIVVTEAHISGPRETQMRWLSEVWKAATEVRKEGGDIRAVTAWSLLGAYGWTSLCTAEPGDEVYESGVFDLRSGAPKATALSKMISSFARGENYDHPVLGRGGYWTDVSRIRFAHPEFAHAQASGHRVVENPLVITKGESTLAQAFARECEARGLDYLVLATSDTCGDAPQELSAVSSWAIVDPDQYPEIAKALWAQPEVVTTLIHEVLNQLLDTEQTLDHEGPRRSRQPQKFASFARSAKPPLHPSPRKDLI